MPVKALFSACVNFMISCAIAVTVGVQLSVCVETMSSPSLLGGPGYMELQQMQQWARNR